MESQSKMNFMPNSLIQFKGLSGCREGLDNETWYSIFIHETLILVKMVEEFSLP